MLEEPWACLRVHNLKTTAMVQTVKGMGENGEDGENGVEGWPSILHVLPLLCHSCVLCTLPPASWHYFSCFFFIFCPLPHTRFRVWAQSLALILVLVLGYNSYLPLSSKRQPSLIQPDPAWPSPIDGSPRMDLGGHDFCQDFLAPVKIRKYEGRGSSNWFYLEAELIKEGKKEEGLLIS